MKNIGPELNRIMTERRIVRKDIAKEVGIPVGGINLS